MEVDELQRRQLFNDLDRAIGPDSAAVLMAHLPPSGWADIVTKHDLDLRLDAFGTRLMSEIRQEFAEVRKEMAADSKAIRAEMAETSKAIRAEMAEDSKAIRAEMAAQGNELRRDLTDIQHKVFVSVAGLVLSVNSILLAAFAFLR